MLNTVMPIDPSRWRALACSEASASCYASAASYGFSKDVGVPAVIETELKFCEVERQIFLRDVMISADHTALQQAPEVFQIVGMDFASHVLTRAMADRFMAIAKRFEIAIAAVLIGRHEVNLVAAA